jgi:hypothetical protein
LDCLSRVGVKVQIENTLIYYTSSQFFAKWSS